MTAPRIPRPAVWLALLLFGANAWLCHELFRIEWLAHMHSIEGAYIGISQWILTHWPDLAWFPAWYGGIPFQNAYPPLLHVMVAAYAKVAGASPALAHHAVTAFLYCVSPVALFGLALVLTKSRAAAFVAALGYSALSPSAWLMPAVAADLGSYFAPRRLQTLVYYGEGPTVAAMAWMPLAILFVHLAVETRRTVWFVGAILAVAATATSNWIVAFALAVAMAAYVLARLPKPDVLARLGLIAVAAYALASPWVLPSTVRVMQGNAQTIGGDFRAAYGLLPMRLTIAFVVLALLAYAAHRVRMRWQLRFALFLTLMIGALPLLAAWADIKVVPQPERYHVEMELAIWLLAAVVLTMLRRKVFAVAATALVIVCLIGGRSDRRYARNVLLRQLDIHERTEFKTAQWIDANLRGKRVYVPGATSFFLQDFTTTAQLGGGFENGVTNSKIRDAMFSICVGAPPVPPGLNLLWLKALGVQAIAYGGEDSGEHYKPMRHPEEWATLETLWRDGGDAIGRVPQRSASLARVITRRDLANIESYVAALEDASLPLADWVWTSQHSGVARAKLEPHHLVSIQESYAPGWHAIVNGKRLAVAADALGLMLVEPQCTGDCTIKLIYDGGAERQLAIAASFFTMLAMAGACGVVFRKTRRARMLS